MKWLRNSGKLCCLVNMWGGKTIQHSHHPRCFHLPNIKPTTTTTTTTTTTFSSSFISPLLTPFPILSSLKLTPLKSLHPTKQNMSSNSTHNNNNNNNNNNNTASSDSQWNYSESDIAQKFLFFNVLKDGRIHVMSTPDVIVPPSFGSSFGVDVKDVQISSDVSARIIIPTSALACAGEKLPVLVYIHGGGFCMNSAYSDEYTRFGCQIAAEANVVVVSVEYGLFPARPMPACYDDSWVALQWVASHGNGSGPDPWINNHADLSRIFVGGDSAGGNISHTVLAKVGSMGLPGDAKVEGMILIHPYFGEDDKMWMYMYPSNVGPQDPRMKPAVEDLARVGCDRVLVLLAEKDVLYGAGKMYADELVKSGWKGKLEIMESKDRDHCFQYANHIDPEAAVIRRRIASFICDQS